MSVKFACRTGGEDFLRIVYRPETGWTAGLPDMSPAHTVAAVKVVQITDPAAEIFISFSTCTVTGVEISFGVSFKFICHIQEMFFGGNLPC